MSRVRLVALVICVWSLPACASSGQGLTRPLPEALPPHSPLHLETLAEPDAWLRHFLMMGETDGALEVLEAEAGRADSLLGWLQRAVVLREAGEFKASNELLERADVETERRRVRSVSRTAGSFIINDRVLSYVPSTGEAAMIPYYRMMNYLALDDSDGAAVEARRIAAILASADPDRSRRCNEEAMLEYVSGLVFEAAGEANDALVSLRRAEASFRACSGASEATPPGFGADLYRIAARLGVSEVADSAVARYGNAFAGGEQGEGEVLLLLERGFIAHRTERAINVPLFEDDIDELDRDDSDGIAAVAARMTAALLHDFAGRGYYGYSRDNDRAVQVGKALSGAYVLRLAWPSLAGEERRDRTLKVVANHDTATAVAMGDLSAVAERELEEARVALLSRMVARGVTKYLASRELEQKAEKQGGELAGFITGRLANLAANQTERADTRSWTLLPDGIAVARLRLPAGRHELRVREAGGAAGAGTSDAHTLVVVVDVLPGEVTVVSRRIWATAPLRAPPPAGTQL
ncbi:MAG: hypothetical protein WD737_03310 [Gemmatimonadota bacterium]